MTVPTEASTSLSDRLAALKDRMGAGPEPESLTTAVAQLDDQQGHLLSLVASLTEDVQDLTPRLVAELHELVPSPASTPDLTPRLESLEQLVRALAEVINENADSHQAALSTMRDAQPFVDLTPQLEALEHLVHQLTDAVHDSADAQVAALTSLRATVDAHAQSMTAALADVHSHIDSAALAVVEALLSRR